MKKRFSKRYKPKRDIIKYGEKIPDRVIAGILEVWANTGSVKKAADAFEIDADTASGIVYKYEYTSYNPVRKRNKIRTLLDQVEKVICPHCDEETTILKMFPVFNCEHCLGIFDYKLRTFEKTNPFEDWNGE